MRLPDLLADSQRSTEDLAQATGAHAPSLRRLLRALAAYLRRVIARGRVYLSNATIYGHFALRACFVNHRTRASDVDEIVREVIAAAGELNA